MLTPRSPFTSAPSAALTLLAPALLASTAAASSTQISTVGERVLRDPRPVLAFDLDGDGQDELIEASGEASAYRVESDGSLTFLRDLREPGNSYGDLLDVAIGDIDGDGRRDLAVIESRSQSLFPPELRVYFDRGGAFFERGPELSSSDSGDDDRVLLNDFDGDGDLDLLHYPSRSRLDTSVYPGSGFMMVRQNTGGQIGGPAFADNPVASRYSAAIPLDLDQDGDLDFVAVHRVNDELVLLRGQAGALTREPVVGSLNAYTALTAGDVNSDGLVDVVGIRQVGPFATPAFIDLLLGQAGGTLSAPVLIATVSTSLASDVVLADGDGDGDLDIIAMTEGSPGANHRVLIFDGDGQGSFAAAAIQSDGFGAPLARTMADDFDGDGADDLLTLSRVSGVLPARISNLRMGRTGVLGQTYGDALASGLIDHRARSFVAADFQGDGLRDVLAGVPSLPAVAFSNLAENELTFESPKQAPVSGLDAFLLAAQLDGDAADEVIVASVQNLDSDWTLVDPLVVQGGVGANFITLIGSGALERTALRAVDVDSDGDLDLVSTRTVGRELQWMENGGPLLGWQAPMPLGGIAPGQIREYDFGDFNGDGNVDILAKSLIIPFFTERFEWLEGLGGGAFGPLQPVADGGTTSIVEDLNGDGSDDLLWANDGTGAVSWLPGGPSGLNTTSPTLLFTGFPGQEILGFDDVDGDGLRDLLSSGARFVHRRLSGAVAFAAVPQELITDTTGVGAVAKLADVGSDGDMDVLIGSSTSTLFLYENQSRGAVGTSFCGPAIPNSTGSPSRILATGTDEVGANELTLRALDLPRNAFGFFIVSQTRVPATPVIASSGQICLGGMVGRYSAPGEIQNSGASGAFELELDLGAIPQPLGFVIGQPGANWSFQAWHRDTDGAGGVTSNFSDGLCVDLR
ncbi:MAG: VCBS repeat-containing protein [Planctomycetota bacterium]